MTVEGGSGLEDADSYVDLDFADAYFEDRGYTDWESLEDDAKEQALIKATDFIDNVFEWKGRKASYEQALNFPRENLFDASGYEVTDIPLKLKQAVCEAAKLLLEGSDLFLTLGESGKVTSEKIGELQFSYDVSTSVEDATLYEAINARLRGLFNDKSKNKVYTGRVTRI